MQPVERHVSNAIDYVQEDALSPALLEARFAREKLRRIEEHVAKRQPTSRDRDRLRSAIKNIRTQVLNGGLSEAAVVRLLDAVDKWPTKNSAVLRHLRTVQRFANYALTDGNDKEAMVELTKLELALK